MQMTGAEIVIRCLQEEGVEYVFGYPGGAVLNIYDELFKQDQVKHVLVRHEQGAAHAADGYSRSSQKVGVCLVTSGPGVTNAVTGIATAYMDSIPMVILTGQVPTHAIGQDAFQECDTVGITRPCVKHNFLVKDVNQLAVTIKKAFYLAATGRPGPVLVDIPKDVTQAKAEFSYPKTISLRSYNPVTKGHAGQIKKAVQLLLDAKRPMMYAGGGVVLNNAAPQLTRLVRLLGFPCTTTLMGLGGFPGSDPQFTGLPGMHGTYETNMAMQNCDVLIAIGARFDDRVIGNPAHFYRPDRKIIHIDIDPSSISKNIKVGVPIVGDCRRVLARLVDALREELKDEPPPAVREGRRQWAAQIAEWKQNFPLRYDWSDDVVKPQYVVQEISNATGGEAFIVTGVGQHQMWAAQYYKFKHPRMWCTSGGLGTMGYGLPTAMGVQAANPGRLVINIDGDGSFQMNSQEMATCFAEGLPVKNVIINNSGHGMVRQWQRIIYKERYCQIDLPGIPDWVRLAEAYGCVGLRVTKPSELVPAIEKMIATPAPVILDVCVDKDECVFPMVPAGGANTDMILAPPTREVRDRAAKSQTGF